MVTEDIKEVRAALLGGILLPDYSYKVDGKGEAETIDKKLKDSYFSLMMILTPFKGVVQIFVTIAAIIGFILVLPTSIPWAWEYTLGCFGWLWEVTGENAIFFVVLFLPFAKVTLVCALLVICAPAALGGLVTSLGGAVVGAVAGAVLYPFLPKVKWKKVAVALPDSQEQDQE